MPECKCVTMAEIAFDGAVPVDGYGSGFFRLAGQKYEGAMMLTPSEASGWQGYGDIAPLLARRGEFDIVLVGTGDTIAYPPRDFRETLEAAGLGVEFMQTSAACRTYNLLLAEGRRVAALMFPLK